MKYFFQHKLRRKQKILILEETMKVLDNFLYYITLDEVAEDLKNALNDKN